MKLLIAIVVIAGAAWWFIIGNSKISETQVNEYYQSIEDATLDRKPEDICSLLADDFTDEEAVTISGQQEAISQNKAQTCDAHRNLYETIDKLGEKMDGILQLDSNYKIHSITISNDQKTATVDISSSLDVAGSIMNFRSRSTDTLVLRNGKVLMLRSEGNSFVSAGS